MTGCLRHSGRVVGVAALAALTVVAMGTPRAVGRSTLRNDVSFASRHRTGAHLKERKPELVGCKHTASEHSSHFVLWVCRDGNKAAGRQLRVAASVATKYYSPMVKLMGAPKLDSGGVAGGGSTKIDLYLVDGDKAAVRRDGEDYDVGAGNVALSVATNKSGTTASGFMLLDRNRITGPGFQSDFVHEFFHILQFRSNITDCGWWYAEASATWAEAYFDPADAPSEVYGRYRRFEKFPGASLLDPPDDDQSYADFIWPFFQTQTDGAGSVARTWKAVKGLKSCDSMNDVLDSLFPFDKHFRDFAVRNIDEPFPRKTGKAETPVDFGSTYQQASAFNGRNENFPDNETPASDFIQITKQSTTPLKLKLPPESTEYVTVDAEYFNGDDPVGALQLDTTGLSGASGLNLDVLGYEPGNTKHTDWIRIRDAEPTDGVCMNWDKGFGLSTDFILVLSNSSMTNTVSGSAELHATTNCAKSAAGTVTHTLHVTSSDPVDHQSSVIEGTVTMHLDLVADPEGGMRSSGSPYTYSYDGSDTDDGSTCTYSGAGDATMAPGSDDGDAYLIAYYLPRDQTPLLFEHAYPQVPASGCGDDVYFDDFFQTCPISATGEPSAEGQYKDEYETVTFDCSISTDDGEGDTDDESFTGSLAVHGVTPCGLFTTNCKDGELTG